jgi:hypothetical protein
MADICLAFKEAMYKGSFFPTFLPKFVVSGVRWNLSVVLICISFMAKDGEHFFRVFFGHLDFFF